MLPLNFHMLGLVNIAAPGVSLYLATKESAVSQEGIFILEDLVAFPTFELCKTHKS